MNNFIKDVDNALLNNDVSIKEITWNMLSISFFKWNL